MTFDSRIGCSSISFRALPLPAALDVINGVGFEEIDLGALPGVCDHVPYELTADAARRVAGEVGASGLAVRSVNGDIGDLNAPLDAAGRLARDKRLSGLLDLAARIGAEALVLPCGALGPEPRRTLADDLHLVAAELGAAANRAASFGLALWTESLHFLRLCWNAERAAALHERLDPAIGVVMDFSHVTASGSEAVYLVDATFDRIRHVHLRDARRAISTSLSAAASPTSRAASRRSASAATPATSPWNSRRATSTTLIARRRHSPPPSTSAPCFDHIPHALDGIVGLALPEHVRDLTTSSCPARCTAPLAPLSPLR